MPQFKFDMGKTRRVSRKTQGVIGPPPEPSASARASAARYEGSAKQASDIAAQSKRAAQSDRLRRAGRMSSRRRTFPEMGPPPTPPGGGGGCGGTALEPSNGAQEDWWMKPLIWAGALGALLLFRRRK